MRIVRQSQFKASPWKNGGGITHEAMRSPPTGDPFRWRVSVAHIDASGPFSDFAGYARTMVLLRGAGIGLKLSDGTHRTMRAAGDLAQFDGALAVAVRAAERSLRRSELDDLARDGSRARTRGAIARSALLRVADG